MRSERPVDTMARRKIVCKLDRICTLKNVWSSIPYQAYYMSCNLDHVLYNKLNSTDDDKEDDALQY
jgi:hypothetical protein